MIWIHINQGFLMWISQTRWGICSLAFFWREFFCFSWFLKKAFTSERTKTSVIESLKKPIESECSHISVEAPLKYQTSELSFRKNWIGIDSGLCSLKSSWSSFIPQVTCRLVNSYKEWRYLSTPDVKNGKPALLWLQDELLSSLQLAMYRTLVETDKTCLSFKKRCSKSVQCLDM